MTDMQTKAVENAVWNPENARGALHLGIDVGSTTVKLGAKLMGLNIDIPAIDFNDITSGSTGRND